MKSKLLLFFLLSLFVGCTHYEPKAEELECDSIPVDFALASARITTRYLYSSVEIPVDFLKNIMLPI